MDNEKRETTWTQMLADKPKVSVADQHDGQGLDAIFGHEYRI